MREKIEILLIGLDTADWTLNPIYGHFWTMGVRLSRRQVAGVKSTASGVLFDLRINPEMKASVILVTLRNVHTYGVFQAPGQFCGQGRDGGHIQPERSPVNDRVQEVYFV